jgi:hypothetical protein
MNIIERRRLVAVALACATAVAFAVAVAFVLGTTSGETSGPRIGDHWHAPYEVIVCGQSQPPIAEFPHSSGIHSHGDGIMHLHPQTASGENRGASVAQFFKNSGGWFDAYFAPEGCITGDPTVLRADSGVHPLGSGFQPVAQACSEMEESAFRTVDRDYVPRDGDCIRVVFDEPGP